MTKKEYRLEALHGNIDEVIMSFYNMCNLARKEGLLSLEEIVDKIINMPLLTRVGLTMVVDGNDQKTIEEILLNLVNAEKFKTDSELVEAKATISGIISIQKGDNPRELISKMSSYLGCNYFYQYQLNFEYNFDIDNMIIFGEKYIRESVIGPSYEEMMEFLNTSSKLEYEEVTENSIPLDYKDRVTGLVISAIEELLLNLNRKDEIIGKPCTIEFIASAMHVLPPSIICDMINQSILSTDLINAYQECSATAEENIRRANYLVDIIMGGDGQEFAE